MRGPWELSPPTDCAWAHGTTASWPNHPTYSDYQRAGLLGGAVGGGGAWGGWGGGVEAGGGATGGEGAGGGAEIGVGAGGGGAGGVGAVWGGAAGGFAGIEGGYANSPLDATQTGATQNSLGMDIDKWDLDQIPERLRSIKQKMAWFPSPIGHELEELQNEQRVCTMISGIKAQMVNSALESQRRLDDSLDHSLVELSRQFATMTTQPVVPYSNNGGSRGGTTFRITKAKSGDVAQNTQHMVGLCPEPNSFHLTVSNLARQLEFLRPHLDTSTSEGLQRLERVRKWMSLPDSLHRGLERFAVGTGRPGMQPVFHRLREGARRLQLVVHRPPVYLSLCAHALVSTFLLLCD